MKMRMMRKAAPENAKPPNKKPNTNKTPQKHTSQKHKVEVGRAQPMDQKTTKVEKVDAQPMESKGYNLPKSRDDRLFAQAMSTTHHTTLTAEDYR